MKHNFRSAVLVLFSFSLLLHADYTVIHPEKMTLQEKTASEELKFFLEKSTGEKVTLKGEGKGIPSGKKIFLGNTAFARTKGYSTADFAPEEWCVRSSGKNNLILTGGSTRGVIYAVLEFLERELGILFADETYTHIPVRKSYQWKETLSYRGKPAFSVRGIYSYFTGNNTPRLRFMLRNRLNLFCDEAIQGPMKKYNVGPVFGSPRFCHNYYNYTKDLPKEAEDCFSLSQSGKRIRAVNPGGPGQICFSNPKTVRIFREKLHAYIEEDLKKYPLDVREFKLDSKTTMTDETVLRCCEALDNSKLVIFGLAFTGWDKLFANKAVANSFTEFMRRGGIAYFGTQTYDSLGKFSAAAIKYFRSVKITPWQRNNYLNFEKGDNGTICKLAEEYAPFCAKEAKFLHVKRFKNDPQLWKSLVVTAKGTPVAVIQENICGKGTVIYSYDLKIFREANHPMLDALVKKAFGGKTAE